MSKLPYTAEQLDIILTDLMTTLTSYSVMVQAAAIVPGPLMAILLMPATQFLAGRLQSIKANINNFKSETTYTI